LNRDGGTEDRGHRVQRGQRSLDHITGRRLLKGKCEKVRKDGTRGGEGPYRGKGKSFLNTESLEKGEEEQCLKKWKNRTGGVSEEGVFRQLE